MINNQWIVISTYDWSQVIISGSSDSTVRVWDVESGEMVSDVTFKFNLSKMLIHV